MEELEQNRKEDTINQNQHKRMAKETMMQTEIKSSHLMF